MADASLLQLRSPFQMHALRFPEMRSVYFEGTPCDERLAGHALDVIGDIKFGGLRRTTCIIAELAKNVRPVDPRAKALVRPDAGSISRYSYIWLYGSGHGDSALMELASCAGRTLEPSDASGLSQTDLQFPKSAWMRAIFLTAWKLEPRKVLHAYKRVGGELPKGTFASVLPMHPSNASAILIDILAREPRAKQEENGFVHSPLQLRILDALDGRAMTADTLCEELSIDRKTLYGQKTKANPDGLGGLRELMCRREVKNERRRGGYYRPNRPPRN